MKRRWLYALGFLIPVTITLSTVYYIAHKPKPDSPLSVEEIIRKMTADNKPIQDPLWRGKPVSYWSQKIKEEELKISGPWIPLITIHENQENIIIDHSDAARENIAALFMLLLKDEDASVREMAAKGLGCYGSSDQRETVSYLVEALLDEDEDVRYEAARQLDRIGYVQGMQSQSMADRLKVPFEVEELANQIIESENDRVITEASSMTDEDLKKLGQWRKLRLLRASNSRITNAGLAYLEKCTKLEHLDLSGTRITDAGLANLKRFTRLSRVNLTDTGVTDKGVEDLKKALPNLEILR